MVAHLLRLRLDLLRGALRGDGRHIARMTTVLVLLAALVGATAWGILRLRTAPDDVAVTVAVIGGAAVTLGFLVAPLVGGIEDPLDPRRFAVFGAAPRPLAGAVLIASIVSLPVVVLAVLGACIVALWSAQGASPVISTFSVVLGILVCMLLAKISFAVASLVLRQRRSRELTGLFLVGLLVIVVPVVVFLASLEWHGQVPSQLAGAVDLLALTPLGAAWAMPHRSLEGGGDLALVTGIAVATVIALGLIWFGLAHLMLTTTERPMSSRNQRGLGWFAVTPGTPAGAIAARSLIYWLRDPRYVVNVLVVPVSAVLTIVPLVVVGVPVPVAALIPVPVMALFFGWLAHNDLAYDSSALWMHIASAVRGTADRVGRLVPVLLIAVPLLAVAIPIAVWQHGRWAILPALVGVSASLLLCGLGLSSIASALAPYPVSRPGDSPFQQPQRTGGASAQAVVLLGTVLLSAPSLWWAWLAVTERVAFAWTAMWGGIGIGLAVLLVGILLGGRVFERRAGRLMEFAESS